jgi:hypothetical protein
MAATESASGKMNSSTDDRISKGEFTFCDSAIHIAATVAYIFFRSKKTVTLVA